MLPKLIVKNMNIDPGKRILVTSDIHGNLKYFQNVLKKASFTKDDILIIVGDIIEKGPESLKTVRYIMDMKKSHTIICLIGNVDAWRLHMINDLNEKSASSFLDYLINMRKWFGTSIFDEMTLELGYLCETTQQVIPAREAILDKFKEEFDFLSNLPTILETQNYIFVHGGVPDNDLNNLGKSSLFDYLKYDNFMIIGSSFNKYVVVGHYPVTLYSEHFPNANVIINNKKKIISIDGGCGLKKDGQLNLIILPNITCSVDEIKYIYYDDLPIITALSDQQGSDNSLHINWVNSKVNLLTKEPELSFVEHIHSGIKLWVLTECLCNDDTQCHDFTNYILPVAKGDILSLIKNTSKGCYVKKDGITGWYYGEIL